MPTDLAIFLATSGHSGVDRLARNLVSSLARQGYTVDVLKVKDHGPYFDEVPAGVSLIQLPSRHAYSSLFPVIRYLRAARPAILFSDKDRVNQTALLAKLLSRVPTRLIFSIGTTVSIDLAQRSAWHRWKTRFSIGKLYDYADKVIVTSEGVADDMTTFTGLRRELIQSVPCPVVPAWVFEGNLPKPDHPWFSDDGLPIVMGLGELSYRKDFSTLIMAFSKVQREWPCRLMIIGKGRETENLKTLVQELGISDIVCFPGFVNSPYAHLAQAKLFVFSSRWEGLGFALIEALAVGIPSVSTDCPSGPREILQGGRCGRLVPVGSVEAMAEAMLETLRHPMPRELLQEAARPYEIERATAAYIAALNLSRRSNGPDIRTIRGDG